MHLRRARPLVFVAFAALFGCDGADAPAGFVAETDADQDGWSPDEGDCNDEDGTVHPEAAEVWYDGVDQDCDGANDSDYDGDGVWGGETGADCEDNNAAVYPGAAERCNEIDDDCNGIIDDAASDALPLYADGDRDGFGTGPVLWAACWAPDGTSFVAGDCDDRLGMAAPGNYELCDGVDNDCNGLTDDDPGDGTSRYFDADGDGAGDPATLVAFCSVPSGWITDGADCDDTDPRTFAGAEELCDERDNDCDGEVDEGATVDRTWYYDVDGDGFGTGATSVEACAAPVGFVALDSDCDDADATVFVGASEVCDGADNDCDGKTDEDPVDGVVFYVDEDADGYGDDDSAAMSCVEGAVSVGGDCNDASAAVSPAGLESCNGLDDDCDGAVDEPVATGAITRYRDADLDGYGVPDQTTPACDVPAGFAATPDDCDDTNAANSPGATEHCDLEDENCNGLVDDNALDGRWTFADADADGYGAADGIIACEAPSGSVERSGDCDDFNGDRNPEAPESDDGVDNDCDILVDEDFVAIGDIVVSEIARQPYAGGSGTSTFADAQWFEVANVSSRTIVLDGWYLAEQDGDGLFVPAAAGVTLEPDERTVFCYDDVTFADPALCALTWADPAWAEPWYDATFYFDRDEDLIELSMGGLVVDSVHWTYEVEDPDWPRTARYSAELDDGLLDATANDEALAWCNADADDVWSDSALASTGIDYGTPGAPNGECP